MSIAAENAQKPLHEILAMEEGLQADALQRFMDLNDTVLIKTNTGSPMKVRIAGRDINVSPQGVRVSPRLGVQLLRGWGYRGKYWARNQATGLRKIDIPHLPEETKARYGWYIKDVDFNKMSPREDYLVHVPDSELLDELDELSAKIQAAEAELAEKESK